jgi:ABC-2 type transport system ATP-binding protein
VTVDFRWRRAVDVSAVPFAIRVSHLRKTYGSAVAVADASFEVPAGEIFGLIGPNGAGKTTTLECIEGLRVPNQGTVEVRGADSKPLHQLLGVQLQASGLPESITVEEALRLFCAYHRVAPRFDLVDRLGLNAKRRESYHALSTGLQRRLSLALAIAANPQIVILDEPTAGLDVPSRVQLHAIMRELRAAGTTVVLSSHDMAEVEELADRVCIIVRGKTVACDTPRALTATGAQLSKITVRTRRSGLATAPPFPGVRRHEPQDNYFVYFSGDVAASVLAILEYIKSQKDDVLDLRVERPSLEERFLEITHEVRP